jgi:RNA polymerase sigma factor (sigma-70 family)
MNYAELTNEEVLQRYYECDQRAGDELERRYRGPLVLALKIPGFIPWIKSLPPMTGRDDVAEDCVSEVLMKVIAGKGRPSLRWDPKRPGASKVNSWIAKLLHNVVQTKLRDPKTWVQPDSTTRRPKDDEDNSTSPLEDHVVTNEDREWDDFCLQALQECVEALPEEFRRLYRMLFMENKKQVEIAKELGVTAVRVNRLLKEHFEPALRECLKRKGIAIPEP